MAFDAGSILGHLGLDISDYTRGILQAEAVSSLFPASVTTFLSDPLLGFADVAKRVGEAAAEGIKILFETVGEVGNAAAQMGLAAEKAGTSVQFFSEWSAVAKNVGVSTDGLGTAFKALQKNASDAVDGQPQAIAAFKDLGISVDYLKAHLNSSSDIFHAVKTGLDGMANSSDRVALAQKLLRGAGQDLIPIFSLSDAAIKQMISTAHQLGAVEDAESVKRGQQFLKLEADVEEAMDGIRKHLAEPVLQALASHMDQITPALVNAAEIIRNGIDAIYQSLSSLKGVDLNTILEGAVVGLQAISLILQGVVESVVWIIDHASTIANLVASFAGLGAGNIYGLAGATGAKSGQTTNNYHVAINPPNPDETATQIGHRLGPKLKEAREKSERKLTGVAHAEKVSLAIGGNKHH